ncbi:Nuclear inhibitor of protein phosphatase 1 [Sarcoptes scabiei]|uniref:Nuclear inhibitor of protein phosphatase 1 n=1 Tax=Sarcoptes scabiei TaxID=52283 RepID=A0A834V8P9_SARSC|nr:Nuclear inhibitor of protein phosphatase 1 [Sarcoptes scabiei]
MESSENNLSYQVPKWAGIPPQGFHLDVMKDNKLVQKLMIDEKNHYLFGRNIAMTDFCIDHASCSRVHAALVYHKNLTRFFLVDLGSTHGSFIGNVRIEEHKPTQLSIDSSFHFGASTRIFVLREKPKSKEISGDDEMMNAMSLQDYRNEIDHLTEYNTAQNLKVCMLGVSETELIKPAGAKKRKSVHFKPDDEIINPEDVDPSVGRFRNLVQTSLIPNNDRNKAKRFKNDQSSNSSAFSILFKNSFGSSISSGNRSSDKNPLARNILAMNLPNSAPDLEEFSNPTKKNIEKIEEDDNKINRFANEDDEDGEK